MHIITISGSRSGVGKTRLATLLLARLTGFSAIKVTRDDLLVSVTDDPAVIDEPGKDTYLLKRAGAEKVVWIRTGERDLSDCLSLAFDMLTGAKGVIVEGNSAAGRLSAQRLEALLSFFVAGADMELKPGADALLKKADVVVVDTGPDAPPDDVVAVIRRHNPSAFVTTFAEMENPAPEILAALARIT